MEKTKKEHENEVLKEKEWYKGKIIDMLNNINEERFLKAIYVSISDYLKEKNFI